MFESRPNTAVPLWAADESWFGLGCSHWGQTAVGKAFRGGPSASCVLVKQLPHRCACLIFLPSWHLNASKELVQAADEQMLHSSPELNCLHSPSLWTNKRPHSCHTRSKNALSNALRSLKYAKSGKVLSHKRPCPSLLLNPSLHRGINLIFTTPDQLAVHWTISNNLGEHTYTQSCPLSALLWTPLDTEQMATVQENLAPAPLHEEKKKKRLSPTATHTVPADSWPRTRENENTHYYTPLSWVKERREEERGGWMSSLWLGSWLGDIFHISNLCLAEDI